ncbi:efflux RND transporter permease subunit [Subtercola sp. PAMC28395]|uniref:efflux RND transporter permease subunit n=1 Tax=Subtercola sp. PAMC28395 TaxID=2846775 RepID=UPI001C0B13A8|nr:efflux RND transporter permease subunit [Subtercola sp. PAMC28395]QWT24804.1 efflux RND transporter permease subunit [Subtercola sp. PAMC28395]
MHFLAVLSMKNRALIALITIVVAVFGGLALTSLKQELIPSIEFPQLVVITNYPGASPEVVNDDLSTPIEKAVQGVEGIDTTSATSSTNLSIINATFVYGTNLASAEQKMNQAISRIKSTLPDGLDPQVLSGSIGDLPVIQVAVTGGDTETLAAQVNASTLTDIEQVAGVRAAQLVGDVGKRVTITPDPAKLAAHGLTTSSIKTAIGTNGQLIPAGSLTEDGKTLSVQAGSKLTTVADIQALPVPAATVGSAGSASAAAAAATAGAPIVTIGDVATVELVSNPVTSISRVNGEPALTIAVTKLPAANTVDVSKGVRNLLPSLQSAIPGATFTVVFDQAPFIQQSIESLATEGLLGLFFAVVIILIFLMSVRSTIVTAISIPTSVLITFIGLQAANYSLNILTLGALTIAIGRVVDDSIVVIENIKRHLTSAEASGPINGARRSEVIIEAVREVATAITASTITTVAVFLPISFVQGTTGELFRPFALTVTIALLASLFVALTIVPVLAYWFLGSSRKPKKVKAPKAAPQATGSVATQAELSASAASSLSTERAGATVSGSPGDPVDTVAGRPVRETLAVAGAALPGRRSRRASNVIEDEVPTALQRRYLPLIAWTLKHSVATLVVAVLILGGTIALLPFMKTNFLGSSGQNTLTITQTVPVGSSLQTQDASAQKVEAALKGVAGIQTIQVSIGSSGSTLRDAFAGGGANSITYSITTDPNVNQDDLQATVRTNVNAIPDVGQITVAASSGFGASSDITVDVTASNQADLQTASDALLASVSKLGSITQSSSNLAATRPYIAIAIDRTKATEAGLSEVDVGTLVSNAMQPQTVGTIVIENHQYTIYIASDSTPTTQAELAALQIPTAAGPVRLDSLATVAQTNGPDTITTSKGLRTATITATPASDNLGSASAEVSKAVADTTLPAGASASLGGATASQSDAFSQLGIALLVAILIVYVVMVATFKSLLQPLLLLVSVPFAATGAIALQVISGIPLGVPSIIGVLMLIGIVVTNAIVLVDLVNQYRTRGLPVREALVQGASRRLRPILMTALATIFALIPMAIGLTGHGGFISQTLAIVVIGGLISSTILTLIVLPVLYNIVEGGRERRRTRRDQKFADAQAEAAAPARRPGPVLALTSGPTAGQRMNTDGEAHATE